MDLANLEILLVGTVRGLGGGMTGSAAGQTEIFIARQRLGGEMTGKTVLPKDFYIWIGFLRRVEGPQGSDAASAARYPDGEYSKSGGEVGLDAEGIADDSNGTSVGRLDAGGGALDVVAETFGGAAVAGSASAGGLDDGKIRGVTAAAHGAVGEVCIQSQGLAAVTKHAAEGLDRVGVTDLRQVGVTSKAVFQLTAESGGEGNGVRTEALNPTCNEQGQ